MRFKLFAQANLPSSNLNRFSAAAVTAFHVHFLVDRLDCARMGFCVLIKLQFIEGSEHLEEQETREGLEAL
jgi:hypothetical protein